MADPSSASKKAKQLPQYLAALSVSLGSFAFGTTIGWGAPYGGKTYNNEQLPHYQSTWIVSSVTVGCILVMLPMSFILDQFGRKLVMLCLVIPFTIGWLLICLAASYEIGSITGFVLYVIGRVLTGFCAGAFCVAVPVFIGEIAQPTIRGTLGVFFELMLVTGIFFTYTCAKFMDILVLSALSATIPIVFGLLLCFIPETPYHLLRKKKIAEAEQSLQWYRGKDFDIATELAEIRKFVNESEANAGTFREKFSNPSAKKSLLIGNGLFVFQQFSGICAIIYYAEVIFKQSNSTMESSDALIILGSVQLVSNALAATFIDKLGRKFLFIVSLALMGICQMTIGTYFLLLKEDSSSIKSHSWIPLVFITLFLVSYSLGAGPISWAMLGELFPMDIKGMAASICSFENSVLVFIVTTGFPYMVLGIGLGYSFMIFGVICFIGIAFVYFVCIETKGKTLEEIQKILGGNKANT